MAFDAGILEDASSAMKWDGTKFAREAWNRDQTSATWMRDSVVWFSQRLTPQLGRKRVMTYLSRFNYGNQDTSGGLTTFWLDSTLKISPDEQLRFWRKLWRQDLPVRAHAFAVTKAITLVDTSERGATLHGKTGSGDGLGWFVGHVALGDREYLFVTAYTDRAKPRDDRPPGVIAREISKTILSELGLY
jgi:beta-lactamase class D